MWFCWIRRKFDSPEAMALQSITLLAFTFLFNVSVYAFLSGANTAVVTVILALISIPLFLTSLFLAIKSSLARDPWGYASALLHIAIIAAIALLISANHLWNTPERQAAREAKLRARWAERQNPQQPRYLNISADSAFYKIATSREWLIASLASLATLSIGLVIWSVQKFRKPKSSPTTNDAQDVSALEAKCPICKASIGRLLVIGETTCPNCRTQFSPSISP